MCLPTPYGKQAFREVDSGEKNHRDKIIDIPNINWKLPLPGKFKQYFYDYDIHFSNCSRAFSGRFYWQAIASVRPFLDVLSQPFFTKVVSA